MNRDHDHHHHHNHNMDHNVDHGVAQDMANDMAHNMDSHMGHHMHDQLETFFLWRPEVGILFGLFLIIGLYFYFKRPVAGSFRYNILQWPLLNRAIRSRYFSFSVRLIPALLFLLVIASGLFGHPRAQFAAGMTWLFWWTLLIFFIAFAGKIFCVICPWDFFANLFQFGGLYSKSNFSQSLKMKWPRILSNIFPAAILFLVLTWLELGFEITHNSYATAALGATVMGFAIISALVFNKRSFCRFACPVGRVSGLYAQLSPLEVRVKDSDICRTCVGKECVTGTDTTTACPTSLVPFKLKENTYCTLCTECVRSCDKNNMAINIRPIGVDLSVPSRAKRDEGIMSLFMLVLTFFHGITMTPVWDRWITGLATDLGSSRLMAFSILMTAVLLVGFSLYFIFEKIVQRLTGRDVILWALAFSFIPITLGYHLGHNSMHLFGEIFYLIPMINDPMGYRWDLFGLADFKIDSPIGHGDLKYLQYFCVLIGFYYSIKILKHRLELFDSVTTKRATYLSYYTLVLSISAFSLWLINQPMVMKSGM